MIPVSRAIDVARALRMARADDCHERLAPATMRALQHERLERIVRHAVARSPFYREHYRDVDLAAPLDLTRLPAVDKTTLMQRFDEWVTDPRLRLSEVEAHVAALQGDDLLLGEYRACATGGTSGRRGIFLFSRAEWVVGLAGGFRWTARIGATPRVPRLRMAQVAAVSPLHMTARFGRTLDVGIHKILRLDARRPIAELAAELDAFRPEALMGYPSVLSLLADEQRAGRLAIAPRIVTTTSEVRTAEMEERIVAAWGIRPFNVYASTETALIGVDCEHHAGLHVYEDYVLLENVDADGRAVPDGVPGSRLLLTNLFNRTQPIIRYELSDIATIDSGRCACGRTSRRIVALDGRSDDVLVLRARDGGMVSIHPLAIRSPFAALAEVRQYQVVHAGGLLVRAVPCENVSPEQVRGRIRSLLEAKLAELGAAPVPIDVELVTTIARADSGKFKLIESRPAPEHHARAAGGARRG
jgi:phenylacetate-coenzyme A ligase PaaK-like adenylate-forming protein